jgi:glutathione S-transferase
MMTLPQREIDLANALITYQDTAKNRVLVPGGGQKSFDLLWNKWYAENQGKKVEATVKYSHGRVHEKEKILEQALKTTPGEAERHIKLFEKNLGYKPWFASEGFELWNK